MSRNTLQTIRYGDERIPQSLGLCPTDPRIVQWCNSAMERLLWEGKWWGTVARFGICAVNGCITLPRQIATVEAVNVNGRPTPVRDFWFEFLANGAGTRGECGGGGSCSGGIWNGCCATEMIMRGNFPTFDDIGPTPSYIVFVCDVASDIGKPVLVLGYDINNNWIRTIQGGVYADGEIILLAQSSGTVSVTVFSTITDIQFVEPMDGQSWLYVVDA